MAVNVRWNVIAKRENPTYTSRKNQLEINLLGLKGGRPYINARLSRFPGESKSDWEGTVRKDGSIVTGRRDQSHSIPYLGRIAEKINQHVLGVRPSRNGADVDVLADITSDGESLNQFIRRLNSLVTTCRWAWIGLDVAAMQSGSISQADKERLKLRPYWKLYSALEVVDWKIDAKGGISWLLTEETVYIAPDPFSASVSAKVRRLWQPGQVTTFTFKPGENTVIAEEVSLLEIRPGVSLPVVPFVLVGEISADPHQFDNLESVNKTIMDLESANRSNFFHCVFPQPYVPASLLDTVKQQFEVSADAAVSMIFGQGYPILLNPGDPTPGYMMPDAAATGTIREELKALKGELFDSVGLMLQQETRQVASAESKAWDYLDVSQVMRERAELLEDAEIKAVKIMTLWDPTIKAWTPSYNRAFDVGSFKDEIEAITKALAVSMPDELARFFLSKLFERAKKIGQTNLSEKDDKAIAEAIQTFAPGAFMEAMPGEGPAIEAKEPSSGGGGNAGTAGARIDAVNKLVQAVNAGQVTKASAILQLKRFLDIPEDEAAQLFGDVQAVTI